MACAGAISLVKRMDQDFLDSVNRKSQMVFDALSGKDGIESVEGLGLMIAFTPSRKKASDIVNECIEKGVLCITAGPNGEKVRLLPPLTITEENLKKALQILLEVAAN